MPTYERSVDVDVPLSTAYLHWTRFHAFPDFMSGVRSVRELDPSHTHWTTSIAGVRREFDAESATQEGEFIAWRSTSGPRQSGKVTFHRTGDRTTTVRVRLHFEPHGVLEHVAATTGFLDNLIKRDLDRFKDFVEHGQRNRRPDKPDGHTGLGSALGKP